MTKFLGLPLRAPHPAKLGQRQKPHPAKALQRQKPHPAKGFVALPVAQLMLQHADRERLKIAPVPRSDEEAQRAIQARKGSNNPKLAWDWAVAEAWNGAQDARSGVQIAHSVPAASPQLHAERMAIKAVCEAVGANFDQTDGRATARSLRAQGYLHIIKWYTELPPCPPCQQWCRAFANEFLSDVVLKYCDELEGYFDLVTDYQRRNTFGKYIEDVVRQ